MDRPEGPVELTRRERQLLDALVAHIAEHGYQPSMRELARAVGLRSASSVHHHVTSLEAKGILRRPRGRPRAIEVL